MRFSCLARIEYIHGIEAKEKHFKALKSLLGDGKHRNVKRGALLLNQYLFLLGDWYKDLADDEAFDANTKVHEDFLRELDVPIMRYNQVLEKNLVAAGSERVLPVNPDVPTYDEAIIKTLEPFEKVEQTVSSATMLRLLYVNPSQISKLAADLHKKAFKRRLVYLTPHVSDSPNIDDLLRMSFILV